MKYEYIGHPHYVVALEKNDRGMWHMDVGYSDGSRASSAIANSLWWPTLAGAKRWWREYGYHVTGGRWKKVID